MVLLGILLFMIVIVAGMVNAARRGGSAPPPSVPDAPDEANERSPSELAAEDPVAALLLYGTPGDAAGLAEQGIDLGALGHRPGDG